MSQIVCVNCGAANRLPDGKDPLDAKCGRCKAPLFAGSPASVTGAELERHRRLTQGAGLLLDVWAPWCGPCRTMAPHFAAAARQLEPGVRLLKLDSEAEPAAAGALNVSSIPTLILFRDGQVAARQAGAMSTAQIVDWTRRGLGQS